MFKTMFCGLERIRNLARSWFVAHRAPGLRRRRSAALLGIAALALACTCPAFAIATITDGASSVELDPASTNSWTRNPNGYTGSHSFSQSWWYRLDSGPERPVSSLSLTDTIFLGNHGVRFEFRDPDNRFRLATQYNVTHASDRSFLQESVIINNFTDNPLDIHLFLFNQSDLDINLAIESPSDYDSLLWVSPEVIRQKSPRGSVVSTTADAGVMPDRYEMGAGYYQFFPPPTRYFSPVGSQLRDSLPTSLAWLTSDNHSVLGKPNLEWAWQWELTIPDASRGTPTAFVDIQNALSVPEPSTLSLVLLAAAPVLLRSRKRIKAGQV